MSEKETLELDEAVAELERQAERDTRRGRVILVVVSVVVVFLMLLTGLQMRGAEAAADMAAVERDLAAQEAARFRERLETTQSALMGPSQRERLASALAELASTRERLEESETARLSSVRSLMVQLERVTAENFVLLQAPEPAGGASRAVAVPVDSDGISGEIDLSIPEDPSGAVSVERVRLTVDPFSLTYTLGCSPTGEPTALLSTPPWITATAEAGAVAPDVCAPANQPMPAFQSGGGSRGRDAAIWGGVGAAAGFLIAALVRG